MKKSILFVFPVFILLGLISTAGAAQIGYMLTDFGSGNWGYSYTITNNDISGGLYVFDIYFPTVSSPEAFNYSNFTETANPDPTNWSSTIFPPSNPGDLSAIYDVEAQNTPLALNASLYGFEVSFTYTGSAVLGSQYFEIYNTDFNLLESGDTVLVPEPGTMMLLASGIFGLVGFRRWAKKWR